MIYCYYDKYGILREIINDESTRQGASENTSLIYVFYENYEEITSMSATFQVGSYITTTPKFAVGTAPSQVPYNAKINYKFFKDNTPYLFFVFEIPSDILSLGAGDLRATNVSCTFTPYYNDTEYNKLGLLTFNLQASAINVDDTLTTSQMDYLLAEISKFEFVKNNGVYGTISTSVSDGAAALSTYPNGSFVLQYVLTTSANIGAISIKGIRFYQVVNNTYLLLYSSVENTDLLYKLEQNDITKSYQINTLLSDVAELKNKFLDFVRSSDLSEVAFSGDYNDLTNKPTIPTDLSQLSNTTTQFITSAVSNLANYYLKSETYTREEVSELISAIKTIGFEVVASLDDVENPQSNIMYLVGTESPYAEYVYVKNIGWEQIGKTDIDLTKYLQSESTLASGEVLVGSGNRKVSASGLKIISDSLNNAGIPTTQLVLGAIRTYHEILTITGDSGTLLNQIDTAYRLIVDENLLVYRRIKNDSGALVYQADEYIDNAHTKQWFLIFNGLNWTRTSVENVSHSEFDTLVSQTPTDITYNVDTKVAQLTHDGVAIGTGAVIEFDGFTPYFDNGTLVLNDVNELESDIADKQDTLVSGTNIKTINNESILGSGNIEIQGGATIIEKTLNEEGTGFVETFTEEELNAFMNGSILKAKATDIVSYYLTPMLTQQNEELGMYGVGLSGFVDTETGSMLQVIVMIYQGQVQTQVMTTNGFASGLNETEVQTLIDNAIGTTLQGDY